jgi:hypothetical protein
VLDAHRDYPTDPTPLLLFFWLLALLAVLISVVLAAARWHQLFGRSGPAPGARRRSAGPGRPASRLRFGSDPVLAPRFCFAPGAAG